MKYTHFISLGYFCGVASELERYGLRDTSSPFDWSITDFQGVIQLIQTGFAGFLQEEQLEQYRTLPNLYANRTAGITFHHDFVSFLSLEEQLPAIQEKYARRIARFYRNIQEPTLFIRYIDCQVTDKHGKPVELAYIEANQKAIEQLLKSFHPENDIVYIANAGVHSDLVPLYPVRPDKWDLVARRPFDRNPDLKRKFSAWARERNGHKPRVWEKGLRSLNTRRKRVRLELRRKAGEKKRGIYVHPRRYG